MHHEIRAVNDYESWGFDMPDGMDTSGDLGFNLDNILGDSGFDDTSDTQLAQIPGDINTENTVDNSQDDQTWKMDKIPEVKDLQPEYEEYNPEKSLKSSKKGSSYLKIDDFNDRLGPGLKVSDDPSQENDWSPSFTDDRNGGPGIAAGRMNLGWNAQFEGPQMIWNLEN